MNDGKVDFDDGAWHVCVGMYLLQRWKENIAGIVQRKREREKKSHREETAECMDFNIKYKGVWEA